MSLWYVISGLSLAAALAYVFLIETRWIRYESRPISIRKPLPKGPLAILHLSDLHFKKWDPRKLAIFRTLGKRQYDLILITGDIIDDHHGVKNALNALAHLRARHGIFCVLGNHDYLLYTWRHWIEVLFRRQMLKQKNPRLKEFKEGLARLGIQHLGNKNCVLEELGIKLVGVDDFHAGMSRMESATKDLGDNTFNILLAHHPDSLLSAKGKPLDLALCGHTHGGQIRLPFWGALFSDSHLPRHLASGHVRINGIETYISRGLSSSRHMSPRFFCRPEVTELVLLEKVPDFNLAPFRSQAIRRASSA